MSISMRMKQVSLYLGKQVGRGTCVELTWNKLFSLLCLLLFIVLVGGNSDNPDIKNYINNYYNSGSVEEGAFLYFILVHIFQLAGVSYYGFRLAIYSLGYFVLYKAMLKFTQKPLFLLICYALSLLLMDSTQTYNFLGMCFLLLGFAFLQPDEGKNNETKYIICVLLACGCHIVFIVFIPFVIFSKITQKKVLLQIGIILILLYCFLSLIISQSALVSMLSSMLDLLGLSFYLEYTGSHTRFGHLVPMFQHVCGTLICMVLYRKAKRLNLQSRKILRFFVLVSLYGFFFFPLFRFQSTLNRLTRDICLIPFISCSMAYSEYFQSKSKVLIKVLMFLWATVIGFFTTYAFHWDSIVVPFFSSNWILGV